MDARAYYIYNMENPVESQVIATAAHANSDIRSYKVVVVREEINGDTGNIVFTAGDGRESKMPFVNENGEWKCGNK
jgi:tRNA C32,U32 (ribose-2'-O)-methylase TrmJ